MQRLAFIRHRGAAAGAVLALLAVGCGGDSEFDSSNRGANSQTEQTSVVNAYIVPRFVPGSCEIQVGDAAALTFTATNNRATEPERLLGIESDAAEAFRIAPNATLEIPPRTSIAAGQPTEDVGRGGGVDEPPSVRIEGLRESARPGTSVDVTFRFERQGDVTMNVPIEACPTQAER
ncbi:hypothetical protein [Mycolicibacterium pulveris]|uniref:hypothetical protein n=1 Tax=Mycolicibacterium pulveris TaxID=36813 RepID=UPI003CF1D544